MKLRLVTVAVLSAILIGSATEAAKPPATWDGLVRVPSKRLDLVYLEPDADFRGYTKVLIEPTEVAFAKDWQRNHNRSASSLSSRVSDSDVERTIREAVDAAGDIFAEAWAKGGYPVAQAAGPDVMRVKTGILNIRVTAPEARTAGRSRTYSQEAGSATFYVEARDSMTGALLGRAVDQRVVGDDFTTWRTSVSNRADFRDQVKRWAAQSVRGMSELKALPPVKP